MKQRSLIPAAIAVLILFFSGTVQLQGQADIWVGSWSCAPYAAGPNNIPAAPYLANNTLRQVVRISIGGDTLRMKFSNKTCSTPVTMNSVSIAVSEGGTAINTSTITELSFGGNNSVTMAPHSSITSDPVAFHLEPGMRLAISIHYGEAASSGDITSHVASRTDSYIAAGDQSSAAAFTGHSITQHWFHINTIDVMAPDTAGCVGIMGNSITDGYGLSGGLQNRWPDIFSEELLADERTQNVGVLNLGIGATTVAGSDPTTGISRFYDDILGQPGLRWVIIFYGVNDIGEGRPADTVIYAFREMIDMAREHNISVYGATITPFKGHGYYSDEHETERNRVNEWIRTPGNFDACIDFDMAIRDPADTVRMLSRYSNDWLHPNVEGYAFLGRSVDRELFTDIDNSQVLRAMAGKDRTLSDLDHDGSHTLVLDASLSYSFGGDIVSFTWSEGSSQIATGMHPTVSLSPGVHSITLTISDVEGHTDSDEVLITILEETGTWLEAECGTAGSLWDFEADPTASNGYYLSVRPGNNSTGEPAGETGQLTFNFEVGEGGTYSLLTRVFCPNAYDDSFWLKMDTASWASWNNIGPSSSWTWEVFPTGYVLNPGMHTLRISYREDGAKLDKLWITRLPAEIEGAGSAAGNCGEKALLVDAGRDFWFCNPLDEIRLGGNPAVSGGKGPYTFSWNCISPDLDAFGAGTGDIISDTSLANPTVGELFQINDTILLELTVRDLLETEEKDTVRLMVSSLAMILTGVNESTIMAGQSVEIYPGNIFNGIPPFTYDWTPVSGLSDPTARNPLAQPETSTSYEVRVTDALGCRATDQVKLIVEANTFSPGLETGSLPSRVYPNPVNEFSAIYLGTGPAGNFTIRVFNARGQMVIEDRFLEQQYHIGNKDFNPGIYFYVLTDRKDFIARGKFMKA